jgi:protein-disulfide isomerase
MSVASKAKSPKNAKPKQSSSTGIWIVVGGLILLAIVVGLLYLNNRSTTTTISAPDVPAEWINGTSLGNPEAAAVIHIYEDFLCPACQQWTEQVEPNLKREFVNTGTARLEFHQFPLDQHNPGAFQAAMATECAADQNMFWPYHDRVFQAAASRGQAGTTIDALIGYADEVGLDKSALQSCINNLTHRDAIAQSITEIQQLGLTSTPSIMVGDKLMENPFDYNALKAEIEAQIATGS